MRYGTQVNQLDHPHDEPRLSRSSTGIVAIDPKSMIWDAPPRLVARGMPRRGVNRGHSQEISQSACNESVSFDTARHRVHNGTLTSRP